MKRNAEQGDQVTQITVKLSAKEIDLLSSLASDQLFRREFIDPRMPGYKANPGDVTLGKQLVERLRGMTDRVKGTVGPKRAAVAV